MTHKKNASFFLLWALLLFVVACQPAIEPGSNTKLTPTNGNSTIVSNAPTEATLQPTTTQTITATMTITPTMPPTSSPTPAQASQILFMAADESERYGWSVDGEGYLYRLLIDGTGQASSSPTVMLEPHTFVWGPLIASPDGSRALILGATTGGEALTTFYPETGQSFDIAALISGPADFFAWHPDNRQILVSKDSNSLDRGVWLLNVDTGEYITLLSQDLIEASGLGRVGSGAVSPDGQTIIYAHYTITQVEIWTMNSDGSNRRPFGETGCASTFTWSPDGNLIACLGQIDGQGGVLVMNADGSNSRVVGRNFAGGHAFPLIWSPDSRLLAFNGMPEPDPLVDVTNHPYHFRYNIHVVNVLTGEAYNLLPDGSGNIDPAWSPDGSQIAFVSIRSGNSELWVANADGTQVRQLTSFNSLLVRFPVWLSDTTR